MGHKITTSKRTLFLGCFLGAIIVLLVPHSLTRKCQYGFRRVFCVPLGLSRSLTLTARPARSPKVSHQEHRELERTVEKLNSHVANLMAVIARHEETIDRLTQLRIKPEWQKLSFVPASVFTALGDNHVAINRGASDHVQSKQFILACNAIVGKVLETDKHQATVELITDEGAFLPVYIESPEIKGILRGLGQGRCVIENIPYSRPVQTEQSVYVNNQPGLLSIPIVVGQVSKCDRDEERPHLWRIEMAPAVSLEELDQVDVILPGRP